MAALERVSADWKAMVTTGASIRQGGDKIGKVTRVLLCLLVLAAIGCSRNDRSEKTRSEAPAAPVPSVPARPSAPRVVALGDSLTAGLGIPPEQAYPALLQQKLKEAGYDLEVINAGVSGDTSADGLRRANWALEGDVRLLILALGANDGLRGLPVPQMKENLKALIHRARQRGIPVLLVGMEAPPNYGEQYAAAFRQVFKDLASENKLPFIPFLLEGVAGVPELNQSDLIHPTSAGAARIADHLWPDVKKMIAK
jgi:acyl-CoA thioesterase I